MYPPQLTALFLMDHINFVCSMKSSGDYYQVADYMTSICQPFICGFAEAGFRTSGAALAKTNVY